MPSTDPVPPSSNQYFKESRWQIFQLGVILMHIKGQGQGYLSFLLSVLKNVRVSYAKNSLDEIVFLSRVKIHMVQLSAVTISRQIH